MKDRSMLLSLFALFLVAVSFGQDIKRIRIEESHELNISGLVDSCVIRIVIPQDYKKHQTIKNVNYSKKPSYISRERQTNYAMYTLSASDMKKIKTIDITIDMELYDYDFSVAATEGSDLKLKKNERKRYLKNTGLYKLPKEGLDSGFLQQQPVMANTVNQIHDFVVDHLEYKTFFGEDKGASYALAEGKGDCTEYSDLMIALCRYNQIPARRVSGITVTADTTNFLSKIFRSSGHAWVEVYFDKYGWVPFDPTHSDGSIRTNFRNLETKYVYLSFSEFEKGISWKWWGGGQFKVSTDRKIHID